MADAHGSLRRVPELDGLRAFAVTAVVLLHATYFARSLRIPPGLEPIVEAIGRGGVRVFFAISGYLIATLLLREHERSGTVSVPGFYARRFFRIVPALVVYGGTILVLAHAGWIVADLRSTLTALLFLGDTTLMDPNAWFVGHTWTLAVEEQFYVAFPILFCVAFRRSRRASTWAVVALYALCVASLFVQHLLKGTLGRYAENVSVPYHFRFILAGVLLAVLGSDPFDRLRRHPALNRCAPLALGGLFVFGELTPLGRVARGIPFGTVEPFLCALFVLWFPANPDGATLLRASPIQYLGRCSYGAYLWQQLFTGPDSFYVGWGLAQSPFALLAILALAIASYELIEKPGIRVGRRLSARWATTIAEGKA